MGVGLIAAVVSLTGAGPVIAANVKDVTALIVNDATNPVLVANAGKPLKVQIDDGTKNVFVADIQIGFSGFAYGCSGPTVVPAGKRLVVEFAGFGAELNDPDRLFAVEIRPSTPGDNRIFAAVPPVFGGTVPSNNFAIYSGSQPMRLYIDDNFMVCAVKELLNSDPAFFRMTVWGYLVDRG
jgi:hypothetical protein